MNSASIPKNQRILIVDDNEAIHEDFRKILMPRANATALDALQAGLFGDDKKASGRPTYELDSAFQGEEAVARVCKSVSEARPYALAFVDMRMPPGIGGVETIERIWKEDPNVQIVICTAYSDESWNDVHDRFGRNDRLLILKKPFDIAEVAQLACALTEKWSLAAAMRAYHQELELAVETRTNELRAANESLLREVAHREAAENKLRHDAFHDALTGLANRSLLMQQLQRRIDNAGKTDASKFAVLYVDLDNFKIINDSLGHHVGDMLIVEVAMRMKSMLQALEPGIRFEPDCIARMGGDEFVVVIDDIGCATTISALAEKLHQELSRSFAIAKRELAITVSMGVAIYDGGQNANELLRNADTAMYRAKHSGKAKHSVFDEAMHAEAMERLELENSIRLAVDREQFRLEYQPVISAETGFISSFEALIRWDHPTRGVISPNSFIGLAEELGLIVPLGRRVLFEACRQLREWRETYPSAKDVSISVNVSKRQLSEPDFCAEVGEVLRKTGIDPADLNLEVTESAIISADPDRGRIPHKSVGGGLATGTQILETLRRLRQLGVQIHIDDFGTGYSSLSILHQYPICALKIDRSFVNGMVNNRSFTAIVHATMTLARNLKLTVIAEGVENVDQLPAILALDCNYVQGFLFSRPVNAEGATAMLANAPCWRNLTQPESKSEVRPRLAKTLEPVH